ncbi:hypothetical protein LCGC14_0204920 [marine sediment metagenome]|uniref:Uncharacterized protein n=1 Tax=marine sediment metagenome TaxID=412755 RepID=A0A0F9UM54_9ZZZZ
MTSETTTLAKLDDLTAAIGACDDPRRASQWSQVHKLLQTTDLPGPQVTHVVGMRDVAGLMDLVDQLRAPADSDEAPAGAAGAVDEATCKRALRAFRKRLSVTVLDDQSTLGRSPLTKGAPAGTPAITPPTEWPEEVWQDLARQGKLRYIGHGFYELPKG